MRRCVAAVAAVVTMAAAPGTAGGLLPGGGAERRDCIAEFSCGAAPCPGASARFARSRLRCTDGAACDADGAVNGVCGIAIAVCLNVDDSNLPLCAPRDVVGFSVTSPSRLPDPELAALQAAVESIGLPTQASVCSDAVVLSVPVRLANGAAVPGRRRLKTIARTADREVDRDVLSLACDPAPPNQPPVVSAAAATPNAGMAPLAVEFSASASDPDGDALSASWNFGDGATGNGLRVVHPYEAVGAFTARIEVADGRGGVAAAEVSVSVTDRLGIEHDNRYPTRVAKGPGGKLYVSDPRAGSVFVYGAGLALEGELKGLDRPLGVSVDAAGNVYVGDDGRDAVEVFNPAGVPVRQIGAGEIQMPNDLAIDSQGRLYVADSLGDTVRVYAAASGVWLRDIGTSGDGDGAMRFPAAVTVAYRDGAGGAGELFVADQRNARVLVFDLDGQFLRSFGGSVPAFSRTWQGMFVRVQSLAVDDQGRVHAADSFLNRIQILDGDTGAYLGSYGGFGTAAGQLNVPLGIAVTGAGQVAVADSENHRVEILQPEGAP